MWTRYRVRMDFLTMLCASVPANRELVEAWLKNRAPKVRPPRGPSLTEIAEEVQGSIDEPSEENSSLLVFQQQEGALVVRAATIKAHLKDCARVLSTNYSGRMEGVQSLAHRIANCVYPDPHKYWIPILAQLDGSQVREASGAFDRPIHAQTPQGPINALKRFEFVDNARLIVDLWVLTPPKVEGRKKEPQPQVGVEDIDTVLEYGSVHGYGGERSAGEGKYIATVERLADE